MEPRRVSLLVGRKSYTILTSLDEENLKEVYQLLHAAVTETDAAMDQDERLFLAGMTLANDLVALVSRIKHIEHAIPHNED